MVNIVLVMIANEDGIFVEEGESVKQRNGLEWLYTATVQNDSLTGDKIVVKAFNIPGNFAIWEKHYNPAGITNSTGFWDFSHSPFQNWKGLFFNGKAK